MRNFVTPLGGVDSGHGGVEHHVPGNQLGHHHGARGLRALPSHWDSNKNSASFGEKSESTRYPKKDGIESILMGVQSPKYMVIISNSRFRQLRKFQTTRFSDGSGRRDIYPVFCWDLLVNGQIWCILGIDLLSIRILTSNNYALLDICCWVFKFSID